MTEYPTQLISIVTVCFNSEKTIARTLESLLEQKRKPDEYIVIDGGSTDGTLSKVKRMLVDAPFQVKIISEKDKGIADAFNKGARAASARWVLYLNSDDRLVDADVLSNVAPILETTNQLLVCGSIISNQNGHKNIIQSGIRGLSLAESLRLCHPATFARRTLFEDVGYFNESFRIAMDSEWFLKVGKNKGKDAIKIIPNIINEMFEGGVSTRFVKKARREFLAARLLHSEVSVLEAVIKYYISVLRSSFGLS